MNISQAIKKEKTKLIKKSKAIGIFENFGQKEVRELEDKFIDSSDYSGNINEKRILIQNFNNWCMNYCG